MSEDRPENSENHTAFKVHHMNASLDAASLVRQIAEPREVGDTIKAAINRVARRVGLAPSRVEDIWRREARVIRSEEMDAIRAAAARNRETLEEGRAEYRELSDRIAALEALLVLQNPNIHRDHAHALDEIRRRLDRPVAQGER